MGEDLDFDRIYSDYYETVYGTCLRLCRDPHLAEEAAQEAFFKALKSIGQYRGECKLSAWLCQIAKNTALTLLQKQKRAAPLEEGVWADPDGLEQRLDDREAALGIHRALHRLEEPYREVFWLRALGELSFAQIARLFEKTESWARVTYHRAKLKLREALERSGEL